MFDEDILKSTASKICVIAAPGCGKTKRVLIPKANQVLQDKNIDPRNVLLLTFSRLSAKDLKERVSTLERAPKASTVHSLCLAFLLSENNHGMRKRVESIVLDFEKKALLADLRLVFPGRRISDLSKTLDKFAAGWAIGPQDKIFEEDDDQRRFKAAVINWLSEHEAAIMEEIVRGAVELSSKLGTSDFIKNPQHIFVDEYQDLNRLEQTFIDLLAAESKLLLVVGDPDQSVYSFKFSHPSGIEDFASVTGVETFRSNATGRCAKAVVKIANQLLTQADPARTSLLESVSSEAGEVHFVRRDTQEDEFRYVLESIGSRMNDGAPAKEIIVLVPRIKLGKEFVSYANANSSRFGLRAGLQFAFSAKADLTQIEQEQLLLFSLAANPSSLLHARAYIGLGDNYWRATELDSLKQKYGGIGKAIDLSDSKDFPAKQRRIHAAIERIKTLRTVAAAGSPEEDAAVMLDRLFSKTNPDTLVLRKMLDALMEDGDTVLALYAKFVDYMRTVSTDESIIRVMTLMGSKGLDADNIYIVGCNSGNLPGANRSTHLSDHEYKQEQRRLLYVGVTRAKKSLTVTWSRYMAFGQSRQHNTAGVRTIRRNGELFEVMGLSEFLQDLSDIHWE